jgi:hypothetical protein
VNVTGCPNTDGLGDDATAVAVAGAVIHNFAWHRRWTWRDRAHDRVVTAFVRFALANGAVSLAGNIMAMALLVGFAMVQWGIGSRLNSPTGSDGFWTDQTTKSGKSG